jgi:hypothetical protein
VHSSQRTLQKLRSARNGMVVEGSSEKSPGEEASAENQGAEGINLSEHNSEPKNPSVRILGAVCKTPEIYRPAEKMQDLESTGSNEEDVDYQT